MMSETDKLGENFETGNEKINNQTSTYTLDH